MTATLLNTTTNDLTILWPARELLVVQDNVGQVLPYHGSRPGESVGVQTLKGLQSLETKYDVQAYFALSPGLYKIQLKEWILQPGTASTGLNIPIIATTNVCSDFYSIEIR